MKELSIFHIEDEFFEMRGWSKTVEAIVSDYFEELGEPRFTTTSLLKKNSSEDSFWEVYEIGWDAEAVIRYIFIRDPVIPAELEAYITPRNIFVLDVLRPEAKGYKLKTSIQESIDSIRAIRTEREVDEIVLFTAYNGADLDLGAGVEYERIDKVKKDDLRLFFTKRIIAFLQSLASG